MTSPKQFITNEKGEKIAVVISIKEYEELLEEIEDLQASANTTPQRRRVKCPFLWSKPSKKFAATASELRCKHPQRRKELDAIPSPLYEKIEEKLLSLRDTPRPSGCKKLEGTENNWRLRVADYRVIYEIDDRLQTIVVIKVAYRSSAYR